MRVWVDSKEAREIRRWAAEAGWLALADRFFRAERQDYYPWKPPFLWRWKARHPVLLKCLCCERWEGFKSNRSARKHGWMRYHGEGWIHGSCVEHWERHAKEIFAARHEARQRQDAEAFFFSQPELLEKYRGVLVRLAPAHEHTFFGLLDDLESAITAESGMKRIRNVIDALPSKVRADLVAVGFRGFHHTYHLLLAWAESIPPEYDDPELPDDVTCSSIVVEEVPKRVRDRLPESLRSKL